VDSSPPPSLSLRNVTLHDVYTLLVRTVRDASHDRVLGLAAEIAFFALFALPPTLLALLGAAGYVGDALGPDVTRRIVQEVVSLSQSFLTPRTVNAVIVPAVTSVLTEGRADVFSIGMVVALWSASRSAYVVIQALVIAYDLEFSRSLIKRRLVAILFTLAGLAVGAVVLPLIVAGPRFGATLVEPFGLSVGFAVAWRVLYWPFIAVLSVLLLTTVYHFAVPWRTPFRRDLPGALLALLLWIVAAVGVRYYVTWTIHSSSVYGSLAAPIVVLLWLYVTALAVLMGAELNAEIEKMWPTVSTSERWADFRREANERYDGQATAPSRRKPCPDEPPSSADEPAADEPNDSRPPPDD
jgi:membrane protein